MGRCCEGEVTCRWRKKHNVSGSGHAPHRSDRGPWTLERKFSELYGAYVEGREPESEELNVQYVGNHSVWEREWLQGELLKVAIWGIGKRQLAEVWILQVPTGRDAFNDGESSLRSVEFMVQ